MATIDSYPGLTLEGGYRTGNAVGKGNFAWVYEGLAPSGEKVAIKILARRDEQAQRRFLREIKVIREIPANEHCVQYRAHGETDDGAPWLALEFITG